MMSRIFLNKSNKMLDYNYFLEREMPISKRLIEIIKKKNEENKLKR